LAVDPARSSWIAKAEAALRALRDVAGVSVQAEGDEIQEVHVLTRSNRPARLIVRDVQTTLLTRFNRKIDHRIVSVAYADEETPPPPAPLEMVGNAPAVESEPDTGPDAGAEPAVAPRDRIRFSGVNLFVAGLRTQAQVELRWKGVLRMGSASGWSTRAGAQRLIAEATLAAVQEFILDDVGLTIQEVSNVKLGRRRVAMVSLSLLAHRQEKILVGTCAVEQDLQQAVVLATLSALNRIIGGLRTREPTEYVLRPTSA
jgi:hypothetical protein